MQHTKKYDLSIIESSDPFSPEALNDNTRAVEAELERVDAAVEVLTASQLKLAFGTFTGNNAQNRLIPLPFTPKLVYMGDSRGFTLSGGHDYGGVVMPGYPYSSFFSVTEGGFLVSHYSTDDYYNRSGNTYRYFALG